MQPADHGLRWLIVQKPYCRYDRRIYLWRRLVSPLTYHIMPCVLLSSVKGQTSLYSCTRSWGKYATCSGSWSPGPQAVPLFTVTCSSLGVSCWHNENSKDRDIHPVNSETDGREQPGNQKTASRDQCGGGQRAVLGWVRGFRGSPAEPVGVLGPGRAQGRHKVSFRDTGWDCWDVVLGLGSRSTPFPGKAVDLPGRSQALPCNSSQSRRQNTEYGLFY